jgi:glycosyltransferase involved in cell wall biosynthesis
MGRVPFSVLNYTRRAMRETIARLQAETPFDIVQLEGIHLGEYLPLVRSGSPHAVVACDWHNIESEILHRYSQSAAGWARRQYARHAAGKLAQYERDFVNQCDLHVVVSERDRDTLLEYGARVPVVIIENGVPPEHFSLPVEAAGAGTPRFRVVFTGAMDYHANIDAVTTFAREVWPKLHAAAPQLVFTIVGRKPAPAVCVLSGREGIEVTGMVPDVRPYYGEAVAAVIPLRVGGGTRIKILEAMAAGVPVVSTTVGAEGLAAVPGTHYVRADSNTEMIAAFEGLLHDPEMAAAMAKAARDFVRRHDWAYLGDRLAEQLLALRGGRGTIRTT